MESVGVQFGGHFAFGQMAQESIDVVIRDPFYGIEVSEILIEYVIGVELRTRIVFSSF